MLFATMDAGTWIFLLMCVAALAWLLYMATCKPEVLMKLRQQEEEIKQKRHERLKEVAKSTAGVASLAYRLLKRK